MNSVATHLNSRIEQRYVLKPTDHDAYVNVLQQNGFSQEVYSKNQVSITLYFNVPRDPLPFDFNLKVRKYVNKKVTSIILDLNEEYFLEIKRTIVENNVRIRKKERHQGTLSEIIGYLRKEFHPDIQPVFGIQYERTHWLFKGQDDLRITLDSAVDFFAFHTGDSLHGTYMGSETDCRRLEIKSKKPLTTEELFLDRFVHFPTISKGLSASNFTCMMYESTYGKQPFFKELPGVEIESKLVTSEGDQIFNSIKKHFDAGIGEFKTDNSYPWIHTSASVNRYYPLDENESLRVALCYSRVKFTRKDQGRLLANVYGLHCMLRRAETKGKWGSVWESPELLQPFLSEFLRTRRAFWPVNKKTGRFYHISYDLCYDGNGKELRQIEIEYVGRLGEYHPTDSSTEQVIIDDIGFITNAILERFNTVKESTEKKQRFFS